MTGVTYSSIQRDRTMALRCPLIFYSSKHVSSSNHLSNTYYDARASQKNNFISWNKRRGGTDPPSANNRNHSSNLIRSLRHWKILLVLLKETRHIHEHITTNAPTSRISWPICTCDYMTPRHVRGKREDRTEVGGRVESKPIRKPLKMTYYASSAVARRLISVRLSLIARGDHDATPIRATTDHSPLTL